MEILIFGAGGHAGKIAEVAREILQVEIRDENTGITLFSHQGCHLAAG